MKPFALLPIAAWLSSGVYAQTKPLTHLPAGRYQTLVEQGPARWEKGDIILLNANQYLLSGEADTGTYRTSFTAQRIFFLSGTLKGAFARLGWYRQLPAIELPLAENAHSHLAATNLTAVYQH